MTTDKPSKLYRRKWLNRARHQSSAHVIVKIEPRLEKWRKENPRTVDGEMRLADCNRMIDLDFNMDAGDKGEADNVLYKAHMLKELVNEFVDKLDDAYAWMMEK